MLNGFQNKISYCDRCSSTLYWNNEGIPHILNMGNTELAACLEKGCSLRYLQTPEDCGRAGEMELLRLALIQAGLSIEDAGTATANLSFDQQRLAA